VSPLHVAAVSFNIKGENVVDLALSPRTLIIGPNGSRKSSITDAVRFATSGTIADMNGREVVADDGLISTLTSGKELFARVVLSDGRQSQSTLTKGKKKSPPTLPEVVDWPLDRVKAAFSASPDTTRRFLLGLVAEGIDDPAIDLALASHAVPYREFLKTSGFYKPNSAPLDALTATIDYTKKRAADLKKEADGVEKHGQDMASGLGPEPTEAAVKASSTAFEAALKHNAEQESKAPKNDVRLRALETKMNTAYAEYEAKLTDYTASAEALAALEASIPADAIEADKLLPLRVERMQALATVARWTTQKGLENCAVCGTDLTPEILEGIITLPNDAETAIVELRAQHGVLSKRDARRVAVETEKRAVEWSKTLALQACDAYEREETEYNASAGGADAASDAPLYDIATMRAAHDSMQRTYDRYAEVRRAYTKAGTVRAESERLTAIHKACKDAIKRLLAQCIAKFEARVQRYLPTSDRFGVQLLDGEREVTRVGLWIGSDDAGWALHTALSGGEWARVTAAVACAVGEGSELPIVTLDDRAFDSITLRSVCDALTGDGVLIENTAMQVFIATTTVPDGVEVDDEGHIDPDALPGWTIVQTEPQKTRNVPIGADPFGG
jgi:hypothetical protein